MRRRFPRLSLMRGVRSISVTSFFQQLTGVLGVKMEQLVGQRGQARGGGPSQKKRGAQGELPIFDDATDLHRARAVAQPAHRRGRASPGTRPHAEHAGRVERSQGWALLAQAA